MKQWTLAALLIGSTLSSFAFATADSCTQMLDNALNKHDSITTLLNTRIAEENEKLKQSDMEERERKATEKRKKNLIEFYEKSSSARAAWVSKRQDVSDCTIIREEGFIKNMIKADLFK